MHTGRVMIGKNVVARPELLRFRFTESKQGCPCAVTGRNENQIVNDERRGGADRGVDPRGPRKFKNHFSSCRFHGREVLAGEEKGVTLLLNSGGDGGGVTGFVLGGLPEHLAVRFVECDDAGAIASTDVEQHCVPFNQRRAGHAEEPVRD